MTRPATPKVGVLFRGASALIVIAALVCGVPVLLAALFGNPIPQQWSWTEPLADSALLGLLACAAWVFWAQMTACLLIEVIAEARIAAGRSADWLSRMPGTLGGQQALARSLVQAVVAIGVTSAAVTTVASPGIARASAASEAQPPTSNVTIAAPNSQATPVPNRGAAEGRQLRTTVVEVAKGDSLWAIAHAHLGSGERWQEIAALNEGREMPDGNRFLSANSILPGWTLLVPTAAHASHSVTVESGDTLWSLAEEAYDEGDAWPKIFDDNRTQIDDPDLIFPGQQLAVPPQRGGDPANESPPPAETSNDGTGPPPKVRQRGEIGRPQGTPMSPSTPQATPPPVTDPAPTIDTSQPASSDEHVGSSALARILSGGGALLGAGLFAALIARRRSQFRVRRSGRTIAGTPVELVEVEQTVRTTGSAGGEAARFLDLALRDLAAQLCRSGGVLPEVRAARLSESHLELVLSEPAAGLPAPWTRGDDETSWSLTREHHPSAEHELAPYPTLVSIGADDDGASLLIDLEAAGLVQLTGDPSAVADLTRFMAAELAMNPWSDAVDVTLCGVASELVPLNPSRLSAAKTPDLGQLTKVARRGREATEASGLHVLQGRLAVSGADSWMPTVLLADVRAETNAGVDEFLDELSRTRGRSAAALVLIGPGEVAPGGVRLSVDHDRRLVTPWATLNATALGLEDAGNIADLFLATEVPDDEPMPVPPRRDGTDGDADAAGALVDDVTEVRTGEGDDSSLLPRSDTDYLSAAATTPEDLAVLAPPLSYEQRTRIKDADPHLDADLAAWNSAETARPKLRILGPVEVMAPGDRPSDVQSRPAFYAELVAYLGVRPEGATTLQMAEAFSMKPNSLHSRIATLRHWLGADPATGDWYLPESTMSAACKARGVPVYQLDGVLCDADLFTRLRTRGQARGPDGIEDLVSALEFVSGQIFDQLRSGGYGWLADNPVDHYLTAAVVDAAHIVATHALAESQPQLALWAAQRAISAAPSEDKPRLDLAKAEQALGRIDEAEHYVNREIFNRSDDERPPPEPSDRTVRILGAGSQ